MSAAPTTGAVLAGGEARRMQGAAKGLQTINGERILDRVVSALQSALVVPNVVVVANDPQAPAWRPDLRVASDVLPGRAALVGIHAALHHAGAPVLVAAWDMPGLSADLLQLLRTTGESTQVDAVVPWSDGPRGVEPLCAWYSPSARATIEQHVQQGNFSLVNLLQALRTSVIDERVVRTFGDPAALFRNVNTWDDLRKPE